MGIDMTKIRHLLVAVLTGVLLVPTQILIADTGIVSPVDQFVARYLWDEESPGAEPQPDPDNIEPSQRLVRYLWDEDNPDNIESSCGWLSLGVTCAVPALSQRGVGRIKVHPAIPFFSF